MSAIKQLLSAVHTMTGYAATSNELREAARSIPDITGMEIGTVYRLRVGTRYVDLLLGDGGWIACYGQMLSKSDHPLLAQKLQNITPHKDEFFWAPDMRERDEDGRPRV